MSVLPPTSVVRRYAAGGLTCSVLAVGCGSAPRDHAAVLRGVPAAAPRPAPATCATDTARALAAVAARIYDQGTSGPIVAHVQARLAGSHALARAVAAGDASATRRAVAPLLKDQVTRLVIARGARVLADVGHAQALAPITGSLGGGSARYRLAVLPDAAVTGEIHALTGATVAVMPASAARAATTTGPRIAGRAFDGRPIVLSLRLPATSAAGCGATAAQTRALVLRSVALRLFAAEQSGTGARHIARYVATDPRVVRAVAADDPAALRAEIVRLFGDRRLHVVRIRAVTASGRLVNDVGGPSVLAPTSLPVTLGGRPVGTVTLSVQDDAGYMKLIRRFTGLRVQLATPAGPVPGSDPAPPGGVMAQRFTVQAFPTGPLSVTLDT